MKNWEFLVLAFFAISCTQATTLQPLSQHQSNSDIEQQNPPSNAIKQQPANPASLPKIQTIEAGVVWRKSDNQDETGNFNPPWNKIEIANIFFKKQPLVGNRATVIPLEVNIEPLELKILKAQKQENSCDNRQPAYWKIDLEPIAKKEFFEIEALPDRRAEVPFDVAIVYPAVKFARSLKREQLTSEMLPKGFTVNTVFAAIDLTNDKNPDMLIMRYCCKDSKKSPEECSSTCSATYRKSGNSWERIDSNSPC